MLGQDVASGGVGTIYRAIDPETAATVAVKMIREPEKGGTQDAERFAREAALLAELRHPAIVRYLAHGLSPDGARYLVMEWIDGQSLAQALSHGALDMAWSVAVARKTAEALGEAHRLGVIHRDVKPSNIMLVDGARGDIKLIDFGFARRLGTRSLTETGSVVGSPGYMAPEQARGERVLGPQVDVFALGCVLYECLTGHPAFMGQNLLATLARIILEDPSPVERFCPEMPAELSSLVARMLAKNPAQRPMDGATLAADLVLIEQLLAARPPSPSRDARDSAEVAGAPPGAFHLILAADPEATGTVPADGDPLAERRRAILQEVGQLFQARVEVLADGTVVVLLPAEGKTEAGQAAECALALRARLPDAAMVLARWHANLPARGTDDGLDSAVRELAAEAMRLLFSGVVTTRSPGIRLDDQTAELLSPVFRLHNAPSGRYLVSRNEA